tara:strand:- start:223 stop:426 length:204 start_codon:yes stop_codon:yes gene_type:complete
MIKINIQSEFFIECPPEIADTVCKELHRRLDKIKKDSEPFIADLKVFNKTELTLPPQYVKVDESTLT